MIGMSCSGFECALLVAGVVAFSTLAGMAAVIGGLLSTELVRSVALRVGWEDWDLPVRIASFLGAAWLVFRAVRAMDDFGLIAWIVTAVGSLIVLGTLYFKVRRSNRNLDKRP